MTPKNPTNTDLAKKIDKVHEEVKDMNIVLLKHDKALGSLQGWRHDTELVEKTLAKARKQTQEQEDEQLSRQEKKSKIDLNTKLIILVGAVTTLILLITAWFKK